MNPAVSQQQKLQAHLRPVDRHKTQKGTLCLLIQCKQVQQNKFFEWSDCVRNPLVVGLQEIPRKGSPPPAPHGSKWQSQVGGWKKRQRDEHAVQGGGGKVPSERGNSLFFTTSSASSPALADASPHCHHSSVRSAAFMPCAAEHLFSFGLPRWVKACGRCLTPVRAVFSRGNGATIRNSTFLFSQGKEEIVSLNTYHVNPNSGCWFPKMWLSQSWQENQWTSTLSAKK